MGMFHFEGKRLYKVLSEGRSCHGGEHEWSLPVEQADGSWVPGEWTPSVTPETCVQGWHVTTDPVQWATREKVEVYEVEFRGKIDYEKTSDKIAAEQARLIRRITSLEELRALHILTEGNHMVSSGHWYVSGRAKVFCAAYANIRAHGKAVVSANSETRVTAFDKARVVARDRATVSAHGHSTVLANDDAFVRAYNFSKVEAWNTTVVVANDSSFVKCNGRATVIASGGTTVICEGACTAITRKFHNPSIGVLDNSVHVDWNNTQSAKIHHPAPPGDK